MLGIGITVLHNVHLCPVMFQRVHLRRKTELGGGAMRIVSSNLTPSASNFRFSIADLRFVAKENAPLEARREFRELRRTQHRTNSARRYTSATVRSRLELGYRRDQFASLRKTKRQKRRRMLQHDRTGTSDIWCC